MYFLKIQTYLPMRKLLVTIISCIALMPISLIAQNKASFIEQYMEQTKENASAQAKVTAALMRKKYLCDAAMEKALYKVLYQGRLEIEQTTITYAKTPELEGRLAEVINKNDSITQFFLNAAIKKDQPVGNSKFASAVRIKKELSLTQAQIDSSMFHHNRLTKLRSSIGFIPQDYERKFLPTIFNDAQYTYLLVYVNKIQALKNAQSDWKELKQRHLLPGADSAKVVSELKTYNIGLISISDRYTNAESQSDSMKALLTPIPQAKQLLISARKLNSDQQNAAFKW